MLQTDRTPSDRPLLVLCAVAALLLMALLAWLEKGDNDAAEKVQAAECADIRAGVLPPGYRNDCPALAAGVTTGE